MYISAATKVTMNIHFNIPHSFLKLALSSILLLLTASDTYVNICAAPGLHQQSSCKLMLLAVLSSSAQFWLIYLMLYIYFCTCIYTSSPGYFRQLAVLYTSLCSFVFLYFHQGCSFVYIATWFASFFVSFCPS